jgi:hypothetical protein
MIQKNPALQKAEPGLFIYNWFTVLRDVSWDQ